MSMPASQHSVTVQDLYALIERTIFPETVGDLLAAAVDNHGDSVAVDFFEQGQRLTFAELANQVRALAHGMSLAGVGLGTHVAILLPNRVEYPLAWLAIASLGAVNVPLVYSSTPREIAFVLNDADVSFFLTSPELMAERGLQAGVGGMPPKSAIILTDECSEDFLSFNAMVSSGDRDFRPAAGPTRRDLLNIQYTSGTTGLPKGVMQSHRFWIIAGCLPALMWQKQFKAILSDHPFFYIDPQWMLLTGLYSGARVDFADRMSVSKFKGWLRERKTDFTWFPSPLLKTSVANDDRSNDVQLFLGFHKSAEDIGAIESRFGAPIREAYGMTEISLGLSVPMTIENDSMIGSCGIAAPFRRCKVVRSGGEEADPGEIGELWITGDGIFDGYYKRPDTNREAIVDGWFRTGDLFKKDSHGHFWFIGRMKDVVKRSGENISSVEVERVLMEHPDIDEAAVVPVPDPVRGEEVKAFIKLNDGRPADVRSILEHCSRELSPFKRPRYLSFVKAFPYTDTAKIAKHLLVKDVSDLRIGSFDVLDDTWR